MDCEDTLQVKERNGGLDWGVYKPCHRDAKWLLTSDKAYGDKPFKRYVCSYHKYQHIKFFKKFNVKYKCERLKSKKN